MTTQHTPGPWVFEDGHPGLYCIRANAGPIPVRPADAYSLPDAHLIAAAPDLLAACKDVLRCGALPDSWAEPIRAAIAKAEGAS